MAKRGGLGKGLEALFDDNSTGDMNSSQLMRISQIEPNKSQPRRDFDTESLAALAETIKEHGILQPLVVRPLSGGGYQIVAGERRWRASKLLGLEEVPVIVKELDDKQTMQLALIENLQRENLNPIEESLGFRELMDSHGMTQEAVSKIVGRSRSAVANALRLLGLPEDIRKLVREGAISVGHAKILLSVEDKSAQQELAKLSAKGELTVRALEKLVSTAAKDKADKKAKPEVKKDSYYKEMELSLHEALGRKIKITHSGDKGKIELEFYNKEELAELAKKLTEQ